MRMAPHTFLLMDCDSVVMMCDVVLMCDEEEGGSVWTTRT